MPQASIQGMILTGTLSATCLGTTYAMSTTFHFRGFIRGVTYRAYLVDRLPTYSLTDFDINSVAPCGLIQSSTSEIAYSKWVSPKRTRTYPLARIYNTYNCAKIVTVIPVIKDEGLDGDLDKIQYSTVSWMNLLNIYIVLAYYKSANKNTSNSQNHRHKLTNQHFDHEVVNSQISEIFSYKQSALHWNRNLFEDRFLEIFQTALNAYDSISAKTGVQIHSHLSLRIYLDRIQQDFNNFKRISLMGSQQASVREAKTNHRFEHLTGGMKGTFHIQNYLGGIYYLTADEIFFQEGKYIIQESKNSRDKPLPDSSDIRDGLFKLIVYSNLSSLELNDKLVAFSTRLKLTGKGIIGSICFPLATDEEIIQFLEINQHVFSKSQLVVISRLRLEATNNHNLEIEIRGNAE